MESSKPIPKGQIADFISDATTQELTKFLRLDGYVGSANDLKNLIIAASTGASGISIVPTSPAPSGTGIASFTATQAGTYTNYGGLVVSANSFAIISRSAAGVFSISQTALNLTTYAKISTVNSQLSKKSDMIVEEVSSISKTTASFLDITAKSAQTVNVVPTNFLNWNLPNAYVNSNKEILLNGSYLNNYNFGYSNVKLKSGQSYTYSVNVIGTITAPFELRLINTSTNNNISSVVVTASNNIYKATFLNNSDVDVTATAYVFFGQACVFSNTILQVQLEHGTAYTKYQIPSSNYSTNVLALDEIFINKYDSVITAYSTGLFDQRIYTDYIKVLEKYSTKSNANTKSDVVSSNSTASLFKGAYPYITAITPTTIKIEAKNKLSFLNSTYFSNGVINYNGTIAGGSNIDWAPSKSVALKPTDYTLSLRFKTGRISYQFSFNLYAGATLLGGFTILPNKDTDVYSAKFTSTLDGNFAIKLQSYFAQASIFQNVQFEVQLEQGNISEFSIPNDTILENVELLVGESFRKSYATDISVFANGTTFTSNNYEDARTLKANIEALKVKNYDVVSSSNSDVNHIMIYGQSLGSGVNSYPIISTVSTLTNVMRFKEGVRVWDALNLLSTSQRKTYLHRIGVPAYGEMWTNYLTALNTKDIGLINNAYSSTVNIQESYPDYKLDGTELTKVGFSEVFGGTKYKGFHNDSETPATGFSESLMGLIKNKDNISISELLNYDFLVSAPASGSASFNSLVPLNRGGVIHIDLNTNPSGDGTNLNYFESLMADVYHSKRYFDSIGKTYSVDSILYYQESTDFSSDVRWGKRRLLQLFTLINTAVKGVTAQINDIKFVLHGGIEGGNQNDIFYQIGTETTATTYDTTEQNYITANFASWNDLAEYNKNNVILGASTYAYSRATDNIHLSARGSKRHGASMAASYHNWLSKDSKWLPIYVKSSRVSTIKYEGVDMYAVDLKMNAESLPIVLDPNATNGTQWSPEAITRGDVSGFIFHDGTSLKGKVGADNFIRNISVVRGDTIRIIVSGNPTSYTLRYAYDVVGSSYLPAGNINLRKYGNLRDSRRDKMQILLNDTEVYKIDNWCPSFKITL